jgi:uncharacterized membrane protein YhfC
VGAPLIALALAYGLSAGVFEEGARYLVYRFWIKDARRWREGVVFGVGHGGAEAILLGALALYAFFQLTALRDADLATIVPAEQLEIARAQITAYWAAPWHEALAGAVERAVALCVQTSLAVFVLQAFVRRNLLWLVAAIVWHAVIDALAVVGAVSGWAIYAIEGAVALTALISVAALLALRREHEENSEEEAAAPRPPALPGPARDGPMSSEQLDDSRYTG